jgi:hypothetical protein
VAVEATLSVAQIAGIILGSGGVAALGTKMIELASARALRRKQEARELQANSRIVAQHLEIFAYGCAGHLYGTWDVLERGGPGPVMKTLPDFPKYPDGVNWHVINPDLAVRASGIRNRVEVAKGAIDSSYTLSEAQGLFYAFLQASKIGVAACEIASSLRQEAKLPALEHEDWAWDFVKFLEGEKAKEKQRHQQIFNQFGYSSAAALPLSLSD